MMAWIFMLLVHVLMTSLWIYVIFVFDLCFRLTGRGLLYLLY